jgi:hypothetical protein
MVEENEIEKQQKKTVFTWTKPKGNVGSVLELVRSCQILRQYSISLENVQGYKSVWK